MIDTVCGLAKVVQGTKGDGQAFMEALSEVDNGLTKVLSDLDDYMGLNGGKSTIPNTPRSC